MKYHQDLIQCSGTVQYSNLEVMISWCVIDGSVIYVIKKRSFVAGAVGVGMVSVGKGVKH